ncbi:hypothetical protein [Sorangium sp. So ce131]
MTVWRSVVFGSRSLVFLELPRERTGSFRPPGEVDDEVELCRG